MCNHLFPGFASCGLLDCEPSFIPVNKTCVRSNKFCFRVITVLIMKTSVYFDNNICILKQRGPFRCVLVRLKPGNLTRKSDWPKCWNIRTPGAYLGHVFIWRSLVQVLLDIFIHWQAVVGSLLGKRNPCRVQPGARDRRTVKGRRKKDDDPGRFNQEDSSKSEDREVSIIPGVRSP